jgi:hypothetical protein
MKGKGLSSMLCNSFARSSYWCKVQNSSNYPPATNEGRLVRRGLKDLGKLAKFALKSGVCYSEFRNSRKRINDVVHNRKSSCGYREEVALCVSGDHIGWGFVNVQLQGFVCIDKNNLLSFLLQMQKWSIMAGDLLQNK